MSGISTNKDLECTDDFIVSDIDNKIVKIELDKNLFKGQIFEFYNYTMEDKNPKINYEANDLSDILYKEREAKLERKEQIDELKIYLFFVLYHNCQYDGRYNPIINDKQEINAKRLVIQDYSIKENIITFGKKNYIFISPKLEKPYFTFQYDNESIIIEKKRKEKIMKLKDQIIQNEDSFIAQYKKTIKNIKELKNEKKNFKCEKLDLEDNEIKTFSDNNSMTISNTDNNILNLNNAENGSISTNSNQLDDSDKEVKGDIFYDNNKRYIFKDNYHKQIDGIFSEHNIIELIENKKDLNSGLKELLSDNKYNIENGILSHIIYKNFDDKQINKNEPFIIEVKKSMAELIDLLNQIKNISKVVKNLQDVRKLPKYIIGIICSYNKNQIQFQQKLLNSMDQEESPLMHIMNILENNKINVIIGAIKDEQILNYPLGKPDYDDDIGGKTRIDIYYMNTFIAK